MNLRVIQKIIESTGKRLSNSNFSLFFSAAIYLVFAIIFTFPLITNLRSSVPGDLGDPLLNVWTLWWDSERLIHLDIMNYFDANVMFPYRNALAFSEHLTGEAIISLPFYIVFRDPLLVYNILYILSFLIAGTGTYILTYRLTGSGLASFVAGFIYAFVPHRFGQTGHLQTLFSGFFPICIYYLIRLIDETRFRYALLLSLFVLLQSLVNMYYVVYLALVLPLIGIPYIIYKNQVKNLRLIIYIIIAASISAILLTPFLLPYLQLRDEFGLVRDIRTIASLPDLKNLIGINHINYLYSKTFSALDINEGSFFLGITTSVLAIIGLLFSPLRNIYKFIFIILLTFSFLIIAGPEPVIRYRDFSLNYGFLYRFLYNHFPAFNGTRVPMRFYIFIVLAVSIFAGSSVIILHKFRSLLIKVLIFTALVACIILEYASRIPIIPFSTLNRPPEILLRLKKLDNGAVLFYPNDTYRNILYSAITSKPTYTAFTGYIHPLDRNIDELLKNPSSKDSLKILKALGIRYIAVLDRSALNRFDAIESKDGVIITRVYEGRDGVIYRLDYNFDGYFGIRDFTDMSIESRSTLLVLNILSRSVDSQNYKVPLRLYYNGILRFKKAGKTVYENKIRIRLPAIIQNPSVSRVEYRLEKEDFDEIELSIKGDNIEGSVTLRKRFIQ